MGQVEPAGDASSRIPDVDGGDPPYRQRSTLQHVAPIKTTCGSGGTLALQTRCALAQVSLSLISGPVCLTHIEIFAWLQLPLAE